MTDLVKALDTFRSSYTEFAGGTQFTLGHGLDPDRKGPIGIIVFALSDDESVRSNLVKKARGALPSTWENFPVYVKGTFGIPKR